MWLLILLIFVNAVADNESVIIANRIDFGGLPVNILDMLLFVGGLLAIFPLNRASRFVPERVHPLLPPILGFYTAAIAVGAVLGSLNGAPVYNYVAAARNCASLPVAVAIAYGALPRPSWCRKAAWALVLASVVSGVVALYHARSAAGTIEVHEATFDALRSTTVAGDYGMTAICVCVFALLSQIRFGPKWVQALIILTGAVSVFFMPHRSTWLTAALVVGYAVFFLARARVGRKLTIGIFGGVVLLILLSGAVEIYSQATGRDFGQWVEKRAVSMLPGGDPMEVQQAKAWDTRLPGIKREFELYLGDPLLGRGFAIQEVDRQPGVSYRHNAWLSILVEAGPAGLAAAAMAVIGTMVVGRRLARDEATSPGYALLGAATASVGCAAFFAGFMSQTFNIERPAITLGIACGLALKARAMQLTEVATGTIAPQQAEPEYPEVGLFEGQWA